MNYVPLSDNDRQKMLKKIGCGSMESLLSFIPREIYCPNIDLPNGLSEFDAVNQLKQLAAKNNSVDEYLCFLGGGAYDHFIPAVVPALASRGEFATAYTPYQPEASQGTLQAIFEYQSMIAGLTGFDVSNASLYDGGSACAEAALMLASVSAQRNELLVAGTLNPLYNEVIRTYMNAVSVTVKVIPCFGGTISPATVKENITDKTCGLIIQSPNFFGCIEDVCEIAEIVHNAGAFLAQVCNPVSLGILSPPGENGADIAVGEGQPLGVDLSFGGPYFGFITCNDSFLRRMPGRIVGITTDANGRRCFVLTLQAREQHIRREKATSNICTNQALITLRGCIYLSWLGRQGIVDLAEQNLNRAHYAARQACSIPGVSLYFDKPFFNEFCLRIDGADPHDILRRMRAEKMFGGIAVSSFVPDMPGALLVAVTEKRSKKEIDRWVSALQDSLVNACVKER